MHKKNLLLITSLGILLNGCFATTSSSLKNHHLMDKFTVDKSIEDASTYAHEMLEYCKNNTLMTHEKKVFPNIGKAEVNSYGKITIFGGTNYWRNISFERINDSKSSVRIYSYVNAEGSRNAVRSIKSWLLYNSKECDKYAVY